MSAPMATRPMTMRQLLVLSVSLLTVVSVLLVATSRPLADSGRTITTPAPPSPSHGDTSPAAPQGVTFDMDALQVLIQDPPQDGNWTFQQTLNFQPLLLKMRGGKQQRQLSYRWGPCLRFQCLPWTDPACQGLNLATPAFPLVDAKGVPTTIDQVLRNVRLPYFVSYGTLLGLMRGDGIIPWTGDVDVTLSQPDWKALLASRDIMKSFWDLGLTVFAEESMGRICFNQNAFSGALLKFPPVTVYKNNNYVDFFPYCDVYTAIRRDGVVKTVKGPCQFEENLVYPFGWYGSPETCMKNATNEVETPVAAIYSEKLQRCLPTPARPAALAKYIYGQNWDVPPRKKDLHGGDVQDCVKRERIARRQRDYEARQAKKSQ